MEIAIALIGLVAAILGLVTALVARRREVIHRHQAYEDSRRPSGEGPGRPPRPGALVLRSTLFGFAIGTFFGVTALCFWLILGELDPGAAKELAALRVAGVMSL